MLKLSNLFELPVDIAAPPENRLSPYEHFDTLIAAGAIKIERIVSIGQSTPSGEWYDQAHDEWVVLLQGNATLSYADDSKVDLRPGDCLHLPAHCRHRVEYTSSDPPCIWLAVHYPAHDCC
ncbi:cupin domain-containing protein [Trichothermofontia sp.]